MDLKKVKKTYVKSSLKDTNKRTTKSKKRPKQSQPLDDTLEDSFNDDPFDKLLDDKKILRENNLLKKKVEINADFNRDSSLDETKIKSSKVRKKKSVKKLVLGKPRSASLERFLAEANAKYAIEEKEKRIKLAQLKKVEVSTPVRRYKNRKNLDFKLSPIVPKTKSDDDKACLSDGNIKTPPRTYNKRFTKSVSSSHDTFELSAALQRCQDLIQEVRLRNLKEKEISKSETVENEPVIPAENCLVDPVELSNKNAIDDNEKCEEKNEEHISSNNVDDDIPIEIESSQTDEVSNTEKLEGNKEISSNIPEADVPEEIESTEQSEIPNTDTVEKSEIQEEVVNSTIVEIPEVIENSIVSETPQRKKRSLRRSRRTTKSKVTIRKKKEQQSPETQPTMEDFDIRIRNKKTASFEEPKKANEPTSEEQQPVINSTEPVTKEDPFDILKKETELMPPPKGILPRRATRQTAFKINDTTDSTNSTFTDDSVCFVYDRRTRTKISLKRKATSSDYTDTDNTMKADESKMTESMASPPSSETDSSSLNNMDSMPVPPVTIIISSPEKNSNKRRTTRVTRTKMKQKTTSEVTENHVMDTLAVEEISSPEKTVSSSEEGLDKRRTSRTTSKVTENDAVAEIHVMDTLAVPSAVKEISSSEKNATNCSPEKRLSRRRTTRVSRTNMKRKESKALPAIEEVPASPAKNPELNIAEKILADFSVLDKTTNSEPSPTRFITTRKRKTVAINRQPDIQEISTIADNSFIVPDISTAHKKLRLSIAIGKKSVNFTVKSPTRKSVAPTIENQIKLHPGKWRKSLAALRKSIANCDNNLNKDRTSRRISIYVPKKSSGGDIKRLTEIVNTSLSNSIVFEQSDEENLSAITLLDESISIQKTKLHDLQQSKRIPQRQTSCFERSSIFYGIQEDANVIDILPKLSSKQIVLRRCGQSEPLPFNDIYAESQLPYCRKIGEGVYGEVFMYQSPITGEPVVLKIIPIEGDLLVNGEPQKKFDAILSEVVITMELSNLRNGNEFMTDGFVNLQKITCVQGIYPQHLVDLWELYRDNQGTENEHPDIFQNDQLYIVLELGNAGQDLEAFKFDNAEQSYSAFLQTALTLAVAERKLEFEHRDLHWGNILIKRTDDKFAEFCIDGNSVKIPTYGVKTTIIDFTLSRMVYDGCCFFDDLAKDPELFMSTGDYQFEIYRLMRDQVENQFERFVPYTNILWLHYVIDKMINGARYISSKTKKHRAAIHDMMQLRDELLDYKSTADYVKCLFN